jgi:hypothetical protein
MNAPMQCFQNAPANFATAVSYERKMFMKLAPEVVWTSSRWRRTGLPARTTGSQYDWDGSHPDKEKREVYSTALEPIL